MAEFRGKVGKTNPRIEDQKCGYDMLVIDWWEEHETSLSCQGKMKLGHQLSRGEGYFEECKEISI